MPDSDRILEAEKSIKDMASELKKMHDAANLLSNSKKQVEAVLNSAAKVTEITEKFSEECGAIVSKLAETDLRKRLDKLNEHNSELLKEISKLSKEVIPEDLTQRLDLIKDSVIKISNDMEEAFTNLSNLQNTIKESIQTKTREIRSVIDKQFGLFQEKLIKQENETRVIKILVYAVIGLSIVHLLISIL